MEPKSVSGRIIENQQFMGIKGCIHAETTKIGCVTIFDANLALKISNRKIAQ